MTGHLVDTYLDHIQPLVITEAEMIFEIDNLLMEGVISFEKARDVTRRNLPLMGKMLAGNGVNIKSLKTSAASLSKIIDKNQKAGKSPEYTSKILLGKITDSLKKAFRGAYDLTSATEKVLIGMGMLALCFMVSTAIANYLAMQGVAQAQFIAMVVVAPMVEEAVKSWAVHSQENPYIITGVFAGVEALKYVYQFAVMGMNITRMIAVRIITVVMHMTTVMIQKYFKDKFNTATMSLIGYIIAVAVHSMFNYLALLTNAKVVGWIAKK